MVPFLAAKRSRLHEGGNGWIGMEIGIRPARCRRITFLWRGSERADFGECLSLFDDLRGMD